MLEQINNKSPNTFLKNILLDWLKTTIWRKGRKKKKSSEEEREGGRKDEGKIYPGS